MTSTYTFPLSRAYLGTTPKKNYNNPFFILNKICCHLIGIMECSSESVFKNSHEEGKLYAIDSLNNLNEHTSAAQTQPSSMYATQYFLNSFSDLCMLLTWWHLTR